MIKLIATDIDGTLLKDGTLMLDPEYMTVIEKLIAKGIRFVACSGSSSAVCMGISTVKRLPLPFSLSSRIVPPSIVTIR